MLRAVRGKQYAAMAWVPAAHELRVGVINLPPTLWMLLTAIGAAVGWRARQPTGG